MLPPHPEDTIVAISTPPGRGGIGVIRLSGSASTTIAQQLTNRQTAWLPRHATVAPILDRDGQPVDQAVVTWFEKPNSYTAEDVVEIACHGAPVVLRFVVERAIQLGARLAEPGEFTQRAFLNGRLDLTQAEAVRDLIDATTLYQARVALQQVEGALSRRIGPIKHRLRELIALLEAGIDFAEDDVSIPSDEAILGRLDPVEKGFRDLANSFQFGKIVRGGLTLAIVGRPNVGKSSLFNRLLEQDRAIVTETAGTTRDTISEYLSIEGLPVKLIDTAGIRATTDIVESKGVEKSYEALAGADLILAVLDLSSPLEPADQELLTRIGSDPRTLFVGNKSDLPGKSGIAVPVTTVSAATGAGIAGLRRAIYERAAAGLEAGQEAGFVTNIRHERLLNESVGYLDKARQAVGAKVPHEMLLLDLYSALRPIDAITGETTVEDILGTIFSTFCIGK